MSMIPIQKVIALWILPLSLSLPALADPAAKPKAESASAALLWRDPADIETRDLKYGIGGKEHAPHSTVFKFVKEDLKGSNPKFVVQDGDGVNWKVKLGSEAWPETVSSRLVWAAGYFTDEDYFLPEMQVREMPRLSRGRSFVSADGTIHNARLKRMIEHQKKVEDWEWNDERLRGTRELNGLRVMMALINNWDLKDENNAIYETERNGHKEYRYVVSDLGASFGRTHLDLGKTKGDLDAYVGSPFIRNTTSEYVDFTVPGSPAPLLVFNPSRYFHRRELDSIGRRIPLADARWIGQLLGRLSPAQIHDAFNAGGYSSAEVNEFATVFARRVAALRGL